MNNVIVLIATTPRLSLLSEHALPSVINQTCQPKAVVLVSDTRSLNENEVESLRSELKSIPLHVLVNSRASGAAGSWNTGINYISDNFPNSYIAIIDDDDAWQPEHLSSCLLSSEEGKADIVLPGINVKINNKTVATNIPKDLEVRDFLVGNPGWQGSNTFIKSGLATKVGGFTDGLTSGNDKDFAIRILESNLATIRYTNKATVDWMCNRSPDALSAPGSKQKLRGCAQFLKLHGEKMSRSDMDMYFERAAELFALSKNDILDEIELLESING
ncbi:glycosyltransferase [Vibrio vulnificus]|uniref:glycosyltransferase n=1 Tax=Vibrio vulnificus TaxID=672 RepID=UPI001CDD7CAA|nr:glycosyltransferase [Vibrio vulnificus]EGQ9277929.1 glycosyltransferase family 2 protein [Vibrio vulnificus]EIV8493970.1 glycosyltransferase [Vibrio vulnificus]EKO5184808.1 glycosyltransferase [Vibrio vulnificus]ELH7804242.1 glycosyltransferase [Vibrio vulnificus]ELV8671233.1 glycosyltransferase [Vibrio vulnificus]